MTDPAECQCGLCSRGRNNFFHRRQARCGIWNLTDGPIAIAPIGSPEKLIAANSHLHQDIITSRDARPFLSPRQPDAHKGDFGHVLVIGGSVGKVWRSRHGRNWPLCVQVQDWLPSLAQIRAAN